MKVKFNIPSAEQSIAQSVTQKKLTKIIFCLPGNIFSDTFLVCWTELIYWCLRNNIQPILSQNYDSVVYYVRNKCLGGDVLKGIDQKPFNGKIDYDYMLWIDSDIVFKPTDLQTLLSRNLDIVAGCYAMSGGQKLAIVKDWDINFFKEHGSFKFLEPKDIEEKKDVIEVVYSGFGFFLNKRGVFESLEYPWFRPVFQDISINIRDFSSEDVSICQLLRQKGYKIYVDPTVRVGHEKKTIY